MTWDVSSAISGRSGARPEAVAGGVAIARQPILDRAEAIIGFELLYRPLALERADPEGATSSVLVGALADIGLRRLVGEHRAYINVTREFLLQVRPLPLPRERVVLELLEDQLVDAALLEVLGELRRAGFAFALDDFGFDAGWESLVELASTVKLDVRALRGSALADAVARLRRFDVRLIAEKVETRAEYDACRALGFDAFQGYFFARPALVEGHAAPTHRLQRLSALVCPDQTSSFEALERVIAQDAGLAYKLARLANAAAYGARARVSSVREAMMRLGAVAVRRWATLLVLSDLTDRPHQLLAVGLLRARLCELLAAGTTADPARAFTVGLFSIVDALLDTPISRLLDELPFDQRTAAALRDHTGPEGRLLALALNYERGHFDAATTHAIKLPALAAAYDQALAWTHEVAPHLT